MAALLPATATAGLASKLTTRPQYAVLKALSTSEKADGDRLGQGKAELRLYEPLLVAEVRVNTDDIVGAVSHAERELSAYMGTSEHSSAQQLAVKEVSRLLRRQNVSALSGLLESRFRNRCPILSVQDLHSTDDVEQRQLYYNGEPVGPVSSGNNILFAAEHDGASGFKIRFMLAPSVSLANLPRSVHPSIRIRLSPGFVFAAYQFSGNSPSPDKVKHKAMKLESLCVQHGLQTDARQLVVQQHHVKAAPRWLRMNEVLLCVTNFRTTAGLRLDSNSHELNHLEEGISMLVSPLSSFCRRLHRTAPAPTDEFLTEGRPRADRWPVLGPCCTQPVPIQRYCSGRWSNARDDGSPPSVSVHLSAGSEGLAPVVLCAKCSSWGSNRSAAAQAVTI